MSDDVWSTSPATSTPLRAEPRNDPEYVAYLELRIANLESRLPKTDLLSQRFLTRAFAVFGHYMVAGLVLNLIGLVVFGMFALFAGGIRLLY